MSQLQIQREILTVNIGGREVIFETGKIARQANGAVVVHCGETTVFCSACAKFDPKASSDFFPLRVDYQEKFSAAGKTLGGFIKREGRPSQKETLVSRLIDRPIRPLFEEGFCDEVQLLNYVWSYDGQVQPEPLAICAASAALVISDIPLLKPLAGVRVGMIDNRFIINPTKDEMAKSRLDLLLAGTQDAILMIEGACDFLTEEQVLEAIETGHREIVHICKALEGWRTKLGKEKQRGTFYHIPEEIFKEIEDKHGAELEKALFLSNKKEREDTLNKIQAQVVAALLPEGEEKPRFKEKEVLGGLKEVKSRILRRVALDKGLRCDGRNPKEIRPIDIEIGLLPRTHGSTLFTRGETQTLAVCTLGGKETGQRYETLDEPDALFRFYLQYFFPPFSVGEVGRMGSAGRREIGHGKLAERALEAALPTDEEFPYTMRLESNITESNGSSSMASVCGCCLAMMDAGVPLKRPIAGIAMGLVLEKGGRFTILSDILGIEDALGDMDFKITGDTTGITAFQMDIKVEGITHEIMAKALMQAKEGRLHILRKMLEVLPRPRGELSAHAPRIEVLKIKPSKIGEVIGPGGKVIRGITERTGINLDISDDGTIKFTGSDPEGMKEALAIVKGIVAEVEVGKIYQGCVTSIMPFGLFLEVIPGKEGLCHISEYDLTRIDKLDGLVNVGDMIEVKVLEINDRGQVRLSRKALLSRAK